ncbi:ATP-binding protein [Dorea sp. AM13-35]|uniref:ATP-binding protein n=1 Tax=Dorea sp. AM13-35 TaxID=2293099 RepID=UPI000E4CBFC5|nr:SbcC/MukB-like Walker B domain-containing protein [Dorea sp. AM13-35]RHO38584.1 ATPase [Dorea sp. AM13-35]
MIRMTRLHLINWHNFQDDIIDFKNITYLLGVNAVGKTTIMDAIRYCLTTNKDFNTAGNKKSGRTLLGSVHQKQRAEDSYLRPGHTVSYIGIEFLDENINKNFVITVRVESETPKQDLKGVYQDWYITKPGYSLEDIPFFTQVKGGRKPTSRDAFKLENKGMDRASNQADARRRICRMLGIGEADSPIGKKFNEVFHMGTSLEDIKDIREFIYTYILPEPEVNIDFLQKDMRELERLQEILQEAQDREVLLAEINERIIEAKARLFKVKVNEILVAYANYQGNVEEQQEKKRLISEWTASIDILTDKLVELSEKERKASDLLYEARRAAEDNTENKEMLSLEQENKENEKEYERLKNEAAIFTEISEKLLSLKKKLNRIGFSCVLNLGDETLEKNVDERILEIKKAAGILADLEEIIKNHDAKIRTEITTLSNKAKLLEDKIKSLEAGVMCYPEEATFVRNKINEELGEQSKKADAKLLCELLYMTDDSWQDAVESYLNTQRFNIIVAPDNYLVAKKVFISLGDKVKGIGLIDTRKIGDIHYCEDGVSFLGDKVESENIYAKRYARFVMRDVVCCETPDSLEQHQKSVTKDRLRFQNFCLQRMGKKEHFIGVDAIEKQLISARKELVSIQKQLNEMDDEKKSFDEMYGEYNKFTAGNNFAFLEKYIDSGRQAKAIGIRIDEINTQILEFKKNPILLAMYDRVSECEKSVVEIQGEITDIKAKKQNLETGVKEAEQEIAKLETTIDELKMAYENIVREYPEHASDVEKKYQDERRTKKASSIAYNFGNRATQDTIAFDNYLNQQLIPLQQKYTATYTCDYPEGIDGASRYQQEYLSLQNIELERHKEELAQAQVRCKDRFRKEVLFRMKDDILRARQQFKQINRVMENLEYGEECYRFGIDKSKDKELGIFYDIIMDKDNQQIDQDNEIMAFLAEANKSEIFESQIEDFMSRIMMDVEEHAKENLTGTRSGAKSMGMYVDYRTYLDYDIIVKNSVTDIEVPLSKVSGEGSGGENQAPFYVAICASLLQIYEQNPDGCMRLILLDEAFNNMTSDRIEPMMNMFKKLNLQLVLIATAEKATSILPYCDITYSIVKSGNRNAIRSFEKI